jgi:hypothetical protein
MGRPKLKEDDKKGKLGITISKELINKINKITNNKSLFIEDLIIKFFNDGN